MNVNSKPFEAPAVVDKSSKTELDSTNAGPKHAAQETLQTRGGRGGARGARGGQKQQQQPREQ